MTTFSVRPDALREMGKVLLRASDELGQMDPKRGGVGEAGSDRVEHALDRFLSDWSDGTHRIGAQLGDLSLGMFQAAAAYSRAETEISTAAAQLAGPATRMLTP